MAVVLLTACSTDQGGRLAGESTRLTTSPASEPPSPSSEERATAAPEAKRAKPLVDDCDRARTMNTAFPERTDLVIGPLSYAGIRRTAPMKEPNWGSGYFYKSGAQLRPGQSATISIMGSASRYAAIITESGPARGSHTVTYRSCANTTPTGYWWVGGFVLWGRHTACVPVKVTNPSGTSEHRATISLGAGRCD